MKWVCATDFLLFDFPIWISAGWMDALLLLLQLRNSLSEFGPTLIRPPPTPHTPTCSLPSHPICRASVTWEPAHTQNTNYYTSLCNYYRESRTFKHGPLHEAQLSHYRNTGEWNSGTGSRMKQLFPAVHSIRQVFPGYNANFLTFEAPAAEKAAFRNTMVLYFLKSHVGQEAAF